MKAGQKKINTSMISLLQYLLSICVIVVHCGSLTGYEPLHFTLKSIFGRMAVPFFIICASFFLKPRLDDLKNIRGYLSKLLKTYLFWSLLYLPYTISYFFSLHLPIYLLPLGLVVALLYLGMSYQLWYIPAFLLGFFLVNLSLKHLGMRKIGILVCLLYSWGLLETYSAYLHHTLLLDWYQTYAHLFFTARNGIFYTPIFIYAGYYLAEYYQRRTFSSRPLSKLTLAFSFLCLEGVVVHAHQGMDKNFFALLPLFSIFLFNACTRVSWLGQYDLRRFKAYSIYYYFLHPLFIEVALFFLKNSAMSTYDKGKILFTAALVGSHLTSEFILYYQKRRRRSSPLGQNVIK